jgi:hypothetical protein
MTDNNSDIRIRNCVFGFRCAQNWNAMDETSRDDVRYCRECAKEVYFVDTQFELFDAINKNRCVAINPNSENERLPSDGIGIILGKVSSYEEIHNEPEPNAAFRKRMRDKKII